MSRVSITARIFEKIKKMRSEEAAVYVRRLYKKDRVSVSYISSCLHKKYRGAIREQNIDRKTVVHITPKQCYVLTPKDIVGCVYNDQFTLHHYGDCEACRIEYGNPFRVE